MKICKIDKCQKKVNAIGLCSMHYWRMKNYGDCLYERSIEKKKCKINGCNNSNLAKGLCTKHYKRLKKYGNPLGGSNTFYGEPIKWISDNLEYSANECLIWPYSRNCKGYGTTTIDGKREWAHVVFCTITHGPKPTQKHQVRHICGMGHTGCVNPKHLIWGTASENMMDKLEHGTDNRGEKSPNAKLKKTDVMEIVELITQGVSCNLISKRYNVSKAAIREIKVGNNWKWLTGLGY